MIKHKKIGEMLLVLCVSYTIVSLTDATLSIISGRSSLWAGNAFNQLLFSAIAIVILYSHNYFERLSPLTMVIIQYIIAMALVFGIIYIQGIFIELHPRAYRDIFRSFTTMYIIGGIIYYISVFYDVKKQNTLLQEIKKSNLRDGNE